MCSVVMRVGLEEMVTIDPPFLASLALIMVGFEIGWKCAGVEEVATVEAIDRLRRERFWRGEEERSRPFGGGSLFLTRLLLVCGSYAGGVTERTWNYLVRIGGWISDG